VSNKKPNKLSPGLARFLKHDPKRAADSVDVFRKLVGLDPVDAPLPDDMPATEKIKVYARAGFIARYAGTSERFESIWAEAFPEEEKGGKS
jgi:hypothetical protein